MIRSLIGAASVLTLAVLAGPAAAQPIGQLGLNYGRNNLEAFGAEADTDVIQGEGSVVFGQGVYTGQVDGSVTNYDSDDLGGDATAISATGHFKYNAGPNTGGLFGGVQNNDDATLWGLGVEGKANLDKGSVYVQLGYGQADDLDDVDFWAVRAEGNLFPREDLRLGLQGGYTVAKVDFGPDLDMWNLGVDAEYQLPTAPFSLFAGYERGELKDLDLTSDTFRIGARFTFGGSLRERDRAGVGQGAVTNLFGGSLGAGLVALAGEILP